ncbi:hypothetical protein GWI33_019476 [Rhynchophorus ferrugineus]|uniref:Generative cell specific-1/HAP2 domain-containing protein n=1 Tax=Rhynchophorus ferrugineus TaxID=354439 RepID=A0A834HRC6_RHYFE|nr:hypothetical protein GWI33_019476 [Rhynchophorus ferrugineus]
MNVKFYLIFLLFSVVSPQDPSNDEDRNAGSDKNQNVTDNVEPTIFEVKAIFSKCSRCNSKKHITETQGEYEDGVEPLKNCDKKISLILRINNKGITNCKPQYIVLDHVFDAKTDQKLKLLNSYVLKIMQKPVMQSYQLIFENVVNSGPVERILKQNNEGFGGCTDDSNNSACKKFKYGDGEIPYSNGFCCSCNNNQDNLPLNNPNNLVNIILPPPEPDIEAKPMEDFTQKITVDYENPNPFLNNSSWANVSEFDVSGVSDRWMRSEKVKRNGNRMLDQYRSSRLNCRDARDQSDSSHCMEFSDLWYSVYHISNPQVEFTISIQIFEKLSTKRGRIIWRDLTGTEPILVGTSRPQFINRRRNIVARYEGDSKNEREFSLDPNTQLLLIPDTKDKEEDLDNYQEARGGADEYLVVQESDLDLSGRTCNKAGVGYEAFARQPRKCDASPNSCLQNQPRDLWKRDHDLEASGRKGSYFLKHYGALPEDPVRSGQRNGSKSNNNCKTLYMYYTSCYTSVVNIQYPDNFNTVIRSNQRAIITEVNIEALNSKKTTVVVKVLNSALTTSVYQVGLDSCPMELPANFGSITSKPARIPPQHQHVFTLEIYCELPLKDFFCSLEVLNLKNQLVAVRRIRFRRMDRCVCSWYCQCSCWATDYGLSCTPLEIDQFHSAGYQGGMPVPFQVVDHSTYDDTVSIILHIVLLFCLTLWYMGLIKAFLGCCVLSIGLWGLDKILDLPKKLKRYYEPELQHQKVVYDADGWPVHPQSGKKVHDIAPATQFAINMAFFFVFPVVFLIDTVRKLVAPKHSTVRMYDDLDVCKCTASVISLANDNGLQKNVNRKSRIDNTEDENKND